MQKGERAIAPGSLICAQDPKREGRGSGAQATSSPTAARCQLQRAVCNCNTNSILSVSIALQITDTLFDVDVFILKLNAACLLSPSFAVVVNVLIHKNVIEKES